MPSLTVVVPVYNVAPYLDECLDSILTQHADALEVIAVDDASTDASPKILRTYADSDPRLRIITLPDNRGLAYARNVGLDAAHGDHVLFVDSDDWLADGTLAAVEARLRRGRVDVLFYGHARVADDGRVDGQPREALAALSDVDAFTLVERPEAIRLFHVAWNKVYDRRFLRRTGLRFMDGYYEDLPLTYPALMVAERIAVLDRCCYFYRDRPGAITRTRGRRHFEVFAKYDRIFALIDERPELARFRPAMFERMVTHELGILERVGPAGSGNSRRFFRRMSQQYRRYAGSAVAPDGGIARVKHTLVRHDAYLAFQVLLHAYRRLAPAHAAANAPARDPLAALDTAAGSRSPAVPLAVAHGRV